MASETLEKLRTIRDVSTVYAALAAVGISSLVFLYLCLHFTTYAADLWLHWHLPSVPPATSSIQLVSAKLQAYEKRADDLQKLLSAYMGLTSLFGIVIGFGAFFSFQHFTNQAKNAERALKEAHSKMESSVDEFMTEVRRKFLMFGEIDTRVQELIKGLHTQLDGFDGASMASSKPQKLDESQRQEILYSEKIVACFDLFDISAFKEQVSEIYRGLGVFYGRPVAQGQSGSPAEAGDRARARFYLDKALDRNERNHRAVDDRAFFALDVDKNLDEGRRFLRKSMSIDPNQKWARYGLAKLDKFDRRYAEAEKHLSAALDQPRWKSYNDPTTEFDGFIYYNRACYRSLLGQQREPRQREAYFKNALDDLRESHERANRATNQEGFELFVKDMRKDWVSEDLVPLRKWLERPEADPLPDWLGNLVADINGSTAD